MKHEQQVFEDWLQKLRPSGDCETVQRLWSWSSDFIDWRDDLAEEALLNYRQSGKLPSEVSASLADAQAEIARLRGALEEINRTTFDDDANRIAHGALQK